MIGHQTRTGNTILKLFFRTSQQQVINSANKSSEPQNEMETLFSDTLNNIMDYLTSAHSEYSVSLPSLLSLNHGLAGFPLAFKMSELCSNKLRLVCKRRSPGALQASPDSQRAEGPLRAQQTDTSVNQLSCWQ